MSDILGALLKCDRCTHAIDYHTGSGCAFARCSCTGSKEHILESNIALTIDEHRSAFKDGNLA